MGRKAPATGELYMLLPLGDLGPVGPPCSGDPALRLPSETLGEGTVSSVGLYFHRACPSRRAHTSCTVHPMTAPSRSGMWRRMLMWRPCKTPVEREFVTISPSKGRKSEDAGSWPLQLLFISPASFGHQDIITGIDSLSLECCVTSGGWDGTVHFWKIPEESQLIFYGHQ